MFTGGGPARDSTFKCKEETFATKETGSSMASKDTVVPVGTDSDGVSMAAAGFMPLSDSELEERVRTILFAYLKDNEGKQDQQRAEEKQSIIFQQQQIFNTYKTEVEGVMKDIVKKEVEGFAVTWKTDKAAAMEEAAKRQREEGQVWEREIALDRQEREKEKQERERERDEREREREAREKDRVARTQAEMEWMEREKKQQERLASLGEGRISCFTFTSQRIGIPK